MSVKSVNISASPQISLVEYQKIARAGDIIETNHDGSITRNDEAYRGTVTDIFPTEFKIQDAHSSVMRWRVPFSNDETAWVRVIKTEKPIILKSLTKKRTEKVAIILRRIRNEVVIDLKIPQEVEDYYKAIANGETSISNTWTLGDGNKAVFYHLSDSLRTAEREIDNETFSDFGNGLVNGDQHINTAMLRIVGASKGVVVHGKGFAKVDNANLEFYCQRLGEFIKALWEATISETTIRATITFEI